MKNSVALGLAMLSLLATPVMAKEMKTSVPASRTLVLERPVSNWIASYDNAPQDIQFPPIGKLPGLGKLPANESALDRTIRLAAGAGLVYLANITFFRASHENAIAGVLGGVLLFTGVEGYCPAYHMLGINTRF